MFLKIGFAILSHTEPEQLLRLVRTLNSMFGDPPIVCHHDFSQCSLHEALFPTNCAVCPSPPCDSVGRYRRAIGCVEGIQSFEKV